MNRAVLAIDALGRIFKYRSIREAAFAMRPDQEPQQVSSNIIRATKGNQFYYEHRWTYAEELDKAEAISKSFKAQSENNL